MRTYSPVNRDDRTAQFATELAAVLRSQRLTHRTLAEALGVTLATVDSWCRITNPTLPGEQNLAKLCDWLEAREPGAGARLLAIAGQSANQPVRKPPQTPTAFLRVPPTSFVGRTQALQDIAEPFTEQGVRLLSLIGPGGIGKTRLAAQVATELVGEFEGGIWWVSLENLSQSPDTAAQLWRALAAALNVREASGRALAEQVVARLHRAHALLILDNCEQIVAACAAVASRLLRECPALAILVTSREPLQLSQEKIYLVPALALPPPQENLRRAQLTRFEATRLFVERALFAQHGFVFSDDDAAHIAEICRRLDGLALAIELAASCLPQLNIGQIAKSLHDRFAVLARGSSLAPERHQTLRATIAWSYELLLDEDRAVFVQLSVFSGGLTQAASHAVTELVETRHGASLQNLTRKSLLVIEERNQQIRYRMLESIREFAREQLAARDDAAQTHQRHAAYFLQLAERGQHELNGLHQSDWLNTLDAEQDNFRAALQWAKENDEQTGAQLCAALWSFWLVRGYLSEGRVHLDWALGVAKTAPNQIQATLWHGAGALARQQVDYVAARKHYTQAIALYRQLNQPLALAQVINELGIVVTAQGEPEQAQLLYQESLNLSDQHDDARTAAAAMFGLGLLAFERGNQDTRGDSARGVVHPQMHHHPAEQNNEYALAQNYLQASVQAAQDCGDGITLLRAFNGLGELARAQNKLDLAHTHYQESLRLSQQLGHKWGQAAALHNLGYVRKSQGDADTSLAHFRESLSVYRELDEERGIAECLVGIASILVTQAEPQLEAARHLLSAAQLILRKLGAQLTATEQMEFDRAAARAKVEATQPLSAKSHTDLIEQTIEMAQGIKSQ